LELDFSQEDVAFADRKQLYQLIGTLSKSTNDLLQSFQLGNVIKNGVQVAIIGKPNAGKSTLLNSLLNENRAIVSEIAGTTRDTVEEILNIEGVLFRLIDTAGIREHSKDLIETIGIERSFEKMRAADIVMYLFDVNEMDSNGIQEIVNGFKKENIQYLLIGNKVDGVEAMVAEKFASFPEIIFISAKQNRQINQLKKSLVAKAISGDILADATIVTNARHFDALKHLNNSLTDVLQGLDNEIPSDLIALDIRQCLHYLGLITGEITNEDQLDFIFSKFCIGK
jgi:tRNA modification GTPase